jgi:hypothetical protein
LLVPSREKEKMSNNHILCFYLFSSQREGEREAVRGTGRKRRERENAQNGG